MGILDKVGKVIDAGSGVINGVNAVKSLFQNKDKENAKQDARQIKQQTALNEVNAKTSKEMADYEQMLKMQMWKDTNYKAQVEQAGMAGLSKMAVLGGSGGGTTAQGASVGGAGGGSAADAAATQAAQTQSEMAKAQIANLNADTEKKKVEAGNVGADTAGKELDNVYKGIENELAGKTLEDQIHIIHDEARRKYAEASIEQGKQGIMENTQKDQIDQIKTQGQIMILQKAAIAQGTALDATKAREIVNSIDQKWEEIKVSREGQNVSRENMETLTNTMLMSAGIQATGQIVNGLLDWKKYTKTLAEGKKATKTTTFERNYNKKGKITGEKERSVTSKRE